MKRFWLCMLALLMLTVSAALAAPLDEIERCDIRVDPRSDGTLDMRFEFEGKVLDSTSEGPLSWVKIGIPNASADELTACSDNIREIRLLTSGDESFVRIDFGRAYTAGEKLRFAYTLHQKNMLYSSDEGWTYSYTPGWFDEIDIKQLRVRWPADGLIDFSQGAVQGNDWVWDGEMPAGERLRFTLRYEPSRFPDAAAIGPPEVHPWKTALQVLGFAAFFAAILLAVRLYPRLTVRGYEYMRYRGFAGKGRPAKIGDSQPLSSLGVNPEGVVFATAEPLLYPTFHGVPHSSGSRSRGGCACACACACAGGGRAGCSRKDFYGTQLKSDVLQRALEEYDSPGKPPHAPKRRGLHG